MSAALHNRRPPSRGRRALTRSVFGQLLLAWLLLLGTVLPGHAETPGILLGRRLVLHPGLTTELRFDSNVFFSNARVGQNLPVTSAVLRVIPSLALSTVSMRRGNMESQRVVFRLQGSLDYREFLSSDSSVSVHRSIGGEMTSNLSLFPRGAMGLDIYDNFVRSNQVPYSYLPYNFSRSTNVFGLRGRYAPGGQRLTLTVVQELGYDGFDDVSNGPKLSDFNLLYSNTTIRGSWKFLPKTALFVEINQGASHYLNHEAARIQHRYDSFPMRLGVGVLGLITPKLALNLLAGYGYGFYLQGPSPSTAVLQAEVRYKPTFFSTATISYRHDFNNALIGSYLDVDTASLSYTHSIYRASLITRFAWDRMAYQGSADALVSAGICKEGETMPCIPQTDRVDHVVTLDARAEYPLREWLVGGIGYGLMTNQSNGSTRTPIQAITSVSFLKHEAWLRLTVRY